MFTACVKYPLTILVCLLFVNGVLSGAPAKKTEPYTVKVETDRNSAIYAKGETAKFQISVLDESGKALAGKNVDVTITKETEAPEKTTIVTKDVP
ncbi:MAG: hypothetical protein PHV59_12510, partial [Victivallales bacterium]|nr:hypothetical protein [Victivallales bacterium]